MTRVRDIANILGVTEAANPTNEVLLWEAAGGGGVTVYATKEDLPSSGLTSGDQAYVTANSRFYISNGSGWYNVALVNATPTLTISPSGTIQLSKEGASTVITLTGADSDNAIAGLTYSVESDGNFAGLGTISQDSSVFTITPLSEDSATTSSATLTFKVSDDISFGAGTTVLNLSFEIPNSQYTTFLLQADASQSDAQIDASTNALTLTQYNDVTSNAFTPYHPGGFATYFGSPTAGITTDLSPATGDWTIEGWVCHTANTGTGSQNRIFGAATNDPLLNNTGLNGHDFAIGNNSKFSVSQNFAIGQWYHFAIVRTISDTTLRFYVDGVEKASHTSASGLDIPSKTAFSVGRDNGFTDYGMTGLIRDFRYVIGTAVYTSEFTPPQAPLTAISGTDLLLCSLPYIADASGNNNVVTPTSSVFQQVSTPYPLGTGYSRDTHLGSVYFDGTDDYIDAGDIQFGANDFTIEGWFYFNSTADQCLIGRFHNYSSNECWELIYESSSLRFQTNTGSFNNGSVSFSVKTNQWYHIAAVRSGSNKYLFINGILQSGYPIDIGTGALQGESTGTVKIGTRHDLSKDFNGYMSDVRFVTGTAVYTSNFTPPTSKLTAISGTALLTCTNNNTIWDASGNYQTITVAGTAAASNTQRKFTGSSSLFLDGNSDYLQFAHPSNTPDAFNFGTEDFTMETWVYPQATGNNYPSFFSSVTGWSTGASGHRFDNIGKSGKYTFHLNGASPSDPFLESTNAFTHDTWVHYALTREGNTFRMFINGALEASGTYTGSYNAANGGLRLGWGGWDGADGYFAGYLQNVRITKRLARYTANFTPPTAEFEG